MPNVSEKLILWFKEVGKTDIELVGEKSANLGEMTQAGFSVPLGFIVTSKAYYKFIQDNKLKERVEKILGTIDFDKQSSLINASKKIKQLIVQGKISEELTRDIFLSYKKLGGVFKDALVAVRSSVISGDLPSLSIGKKEAFLNIKGEANLLIKIKEIWSSLFDASAIFYRHEQGFDHFKVVIAVPVQKMIESEQSGVILTIDPITNDKSKVVIKAILGLGEHITQSTATPDHYEVSKSKLRIIAKHISLQVKKLVKKGIENKEVKLSSKEGGQQKISERIILHLAEIGMKLEKHYYFPQDIKYAIEKNKIYIIQTRPITTIETQNSIRQMADKVQDNNKVSASGFKLLLKGESASPGIATGPVKILKNTKEINKIVSGDVLVISQANHDFIPAIKKAIAVIADNGDKTSHAAIVSYDLGIPAVVGTLQATTSLKEGSIVTVNGSKGEVYKGATLVANKDEINHLENIKTATKIYVNLAESDFAEEVFQKNVDGVGLLRAEFIMSEIGIHPKKMILDGKRKVYIEKLAENMALFAKKFSPRPVVYRASDFRTDEYRNLKGGKDFEPVEQNPMLGFRGAFRYIKDPDIFSLELEAIKLVRNKYHLKNLWLMIPFVRTVDELVLVKQLIASVGLYRSPSFKIWMMVEIPSNVILLDKFIEAGIDGVSIGSNDLTMLLLGTDCNNGSVATEFDEQNDAVIWALEKVIKTCHKYGITSSLCGQAASSYPKLVEKLVQFGITSVSVEPDVIESTREVISKFEKKLLWQK